MGCSRTDKHSPVLCRRRYSRLNFPPRSFPAHNFSQHRFPSKLLSERNSNLHSPGKANLPSPCKFSLSKGQQKFIPESHSTWHSESFRYSQNKFSQGTQTDVDKGSQETLIAQNSVSTQTVLTDYSHNQRPCETQEVSLYYSPEHAFAPGFKAYVVKPSLQCQSSSTSTDDIASVSISPDTELEPSSPPSGSLSDVTLTNGSPSVIPSPVTSSATLTCPSVSYSTMTEVISTCITTPSTCTVAQPLISSTVKDDLSSVSPPCESDIMVSIADTLSLLLNSSGMQSSLCYPTAVSLAEELTSMVKSSSLQSSLNPTSVTSLSEVITSLLNPYGIHSTSIPSNTVHLGSGLPSQDVKSMPHPISCQIPIASSSTNTHYVYPLKHLM